MQQPQPPPQQAQAQAPAKKGFKRSEGDWDCPKFPFSFSF